MSEVSCRILEMFFGELTKKNLPTSAFLDGSGCSEQQIRDKNHRIPWASFVALMDNAQRIWTDEEIIAMGGAWIDSPVLRHTRSIAGALFTPKQFYSWLADDPKTGKPGAGNQMFSNMRTRYEDLGPDRLALEITLDPGYVTAPAFFLLNKGGFQQMPRATGKARAKLVTTQIDRGERYEITLEPGSDRRSRLHRLVRWVIAPNAVANELDDALLEHRRQYDEIDRQRAKLEVQAKQLSTAHRVNELIQRHLDLDVNLDAIATALIEVGGYASISLDLDVEIDGVKIVRTAQKGTGGITGFDRELVGQNGRRNGTIRVCAHAHADLAEREELLAFIVPNIAMAIDNAISYLVVDDYRRGLEIRVVERTAELREAKEARDRIFANINHDLRSPLSLILLAVAEARRNGIVDPASEKTLGAIEHGARRVLRMVDELLILAEGRENEVKLSTARCDFGRMAGAVAEAWTSAASAASLRLSYEVENGTMVVADPNALERIMANLVSNALKFTPKGGLIHLSLRQERGRAVLEVRDNGTGIDDDLKKRLFGRFERGEGVRKAAIGGTGLGLSLVKELAEAHGGTVRILDAPGGGALFRVEIPLADASNTSLATASDSSPMLRPDDYSAATSATAEPRIYECTGGGARATILLAEDDPALRDHTARLLAQNYRVIAAPDGLSAYTLAKEHSPDLLVTDIAMPGMDGIELTKRFRALPNNRMAPVLILTTFGGVEDKLAGFGAGAIDHIHKPFEPEELRARVRSQLAIRSLALQLLETEKLAALGTLSAGLAHEIRNPANGIVNAVAPLRELLPPEVLEPGTLTAELLDVIEHCANQVGALSRELLGFQRGVELKRTGIPLDLLLRRVKTTMQHTLEGVSYRETLDYAGPIRCAEPLFAQVLANLIENGAHAAGRGGWVEVKSGLDEQRVYLEFSDSGPGVPEDIRDRIFEPFFTTKPAGKGTGLGLSTARDICLRHGGTLDVRRSALGSVFRLEMPLES